MGVRACAPHYKNNILNMAVLPSLFSRRKVIERDPREVADVIRIGIPGIYLRAIYMTWTGRLQTSQTFAICVPAWHSLTDPNEGRIFPRANDG